jgi:hypothetical protein
VKGWGPAARPTRPWRAFVEHVFFEKAECQRGTIQMLPMLLFTTGYLGFYAQPVAFDCDRATLGVDFVICANRQLMDAESQLEDAY